jgi:hypothetical protein
MIVKMVEKSSSSHQPRMPQGNLKFQSPLSENLYDSDRKSFISALLTSSTPSHSDGFERRNMDETTLPSHEYCEKQLNIIPSLVASDTFSSEESCTPRSLESPACSSMLSPSDTILEELSEILPHRTSFFDERSSKATYDQDDALDTNDQISQLESNSHESIFRDRAAYDQIKTRRQFSSMHLVLVHPGDAHIGAGEGSSQSQSLARVSDPYSDNVATEDGRISLFDTRLSSSPRCIPSTPELDAIAGRLSSHEDSDGDDEFLYDMLNATDKSDRRSMLQALRGVEEDSNRYRISFTPAAEFERLCINRDAIPGRHLDDIDSELDELDADYLDEEKGQNHIGKEGNVNDKDEISTLTEPRSLPLSKSQHPLLFLYRYVQIKHAPTGISFSDVLLAATIIFLAVLVWTGRSDRVLGAIQASTNRWLDHSLGYTDLQAPVSHTHSKVGVSHNTNFLDVKLNFIGVWL